MSRRQFPRRANPAVAATVATALLLAISLVLVLVAPDQNASIEEPALTPRGGELVAVTTWLAACWAVAFLIARMAAKRRGEQSVADSE